MSHTVLCPRCKIPLEIPQPAPAKIHCESCGAVIKYNPRQPGEETRVPAGQATMAADPATARRLAAEPDADASSWAADASPFHVPADKPAVSSAGLKVGIAAAVLLVAGLGCLAAWVALKEPKSVVEKKEEPKKPPEPLSEDEPEPKDVPLLTRRNRAPVPKEADPRVKTAVEEGVKYLRSRIKANDLAGGAKAKAEIYALGSAALMGLTLLECDVPPDDPDVEMLAETIRARVDHLTSTYTAGPAILFLDRLHRDKTPPPSDRELIQTLALRLIKAQRNNGLWTYGAPALTAPAKKKKGGGKTTEYELLAELNANTYRPHGGPGEGDLSNTQFAALALWAARRHGVPVDPALRAAANTIRKAQGTDGTWTYHIAGANLKGVGHRDSGTCVGLILLALGRAVEDNADNKAKKGPLVADPAVVAGLTHLGKIMRVDWKARHTKAKARPLQADSGGDLYFLWALERMSLILNVEKITGVDWHAWGSEIILENRRADGSWKDRDSGGVPDTCFALLFLRQANLFQDLTEKLESFEPEGNRPAVVAPPARREE